MDRAQQFLLQKLAERSAENRLRTLTCSDIAVDFCSNDYLGLARSDVFRKHIEAEVSQIPSFKNGATGSRLLSGNHPYTEATEKVIARFHNTEAALLFNSGYDANVGLLSAVPQRGDTLLCDELIHASLIDGARLSYAQRLRFKHNDLADLERRLQKVTGLCYVVVESIYSMDGDAAPLHQISALCQQYQAHLIVDEAHAIGVLGANGTGLVQALDLQHQVFARVVTFGKAMGCHGAAILGSETLKSYLVNFARSFIYTTAAPLHQQAAIRCAYHLLSRHPYTQELQYKISLYNQYMSGSHLERIYSDSCIQTILFHNAQEAKQAAATLREKGFDARAILSPTVPEGRERLRICLHLYNTDQEIQQLTTALSELL